MPFLEWPCRQQHGRAYEFNYFPSCTLDRLPTFPTSHPRPHPLPRPIPLAFARVRTLAFGPYIPTIQSLNLRLKHIIQICLIQLSNSLTFRGYADRLSARLATLQASLCNILPGPSVLHSLGQACVHKHSERLLERARLHARRQLQDLISSLVRAFTCRSGLASHSMHIQGRP